MYPLRISQILYIPEMHLLDQKCIEGIHFSRFQSVRIDFNLEIFWEEGFKGKGEFFTHRLL